MDRVAFRNRAAEGLHVLHQHAEGTLLPDATRALSGAMQYLPSWRSSAPGGGMGGAACRKMDSLKWKKGFHM